MDQVAVHLLPPPQWHHMKGGALPPADALTPADRMDSASSGGSTAGSLRTASSAQRRTSQSTSVPAIQEGILDNDAIGEPLACPPAAPLPLHPPVPGGPFTRNPHTFFFCLTFSV